MRLKRLVMLTAIACVASLGFASAAQATINYAGSTSAKTTGACTDINDPCTIERAAEAATTPGDFIYLLPGVHYHLLSNNLYITIAAGVTLTTLPGSPRATIVQSGPYADLGDRALIASSGTIDNVRIIQQAPSSVYGAATIGGGSTVTRSVLEGVRRAVFVNVAGTGGTFRGNVVRTTGDATSIAFQNGPGGVINIDQSTIWSNGYGVSLSTAATSRTMTIHNSIIHGGNKDFQLYSEYDQGTHMVVDHSNSRLDSVVSSGGGTGTNRTLFDAGGNIAAAPALVNPGAGDFHQLAGSNTIDAGTAPFSGVDLEGNAFGIGCAPDIGAYEFTPPACGPLKAAPKILAGISASVNPEIKHGKVAVKVKCPKLAVGSCSGKVIVKQGKKTRSSKVKSLRPGKSITIKIKAKKGKARITVTLTDSSGATGKKTISKTLKQRARHS
jgi:hypothetical protein